MDLYIYYRVRTANTDLFTERAMRMQRQLMRAHGIVAALKRRPAQQDGLHTWMEVYLNVADDFALTLNQAVDDARLSALIEGPRHTEQFLDLSVCA